MKHKIPLARPYTGKEEIKAVSEVIRSGALSLGPKLSEFEDRFAEFIGTKYAVAVNSGTSGLHLCVKALDIKAGDEVITTPFSFVASSNPVIFERAKPVFADIDKRTCNIDPEKLEKAITKKTKAVILVHLFGQPCNMEAIMRICKERSIPVIEDGCEALGATYKARKVGTFGRLAVFAFYPNKQITTGEGGIIVTNDSKMAKICRSLRNQGRDDSGEWLNHINIGYNYRLDEMSCALGVEQLNKVSFILNKRREIAERYSEALGKIDGLIMPYADSHSQRSWWVYFLRLKDAHGRNKVIKYLNAHGVSSRPCFDPPIHLQPVYRKIFGYKAGDFPITEKVAQSGFIVPFFVGIQDSQIKEVILTLRESLRR